MIREVGGTFNRRVATRIFRDDTGHTIRVTVSGETAAIFPDLPGPNIGVEDLGITGYRAARGCAPRPAGAPRAEEAIARGRGAEYAAH